MVLKRFYDEKLAHASYLVGCPAAGEAIVIDPGRNVDPYIEAANNEGVRITAVTETHIHADLLSGLRELSARTGAQMYLSDEGTEEWKYAFSDDPKVTLVKDGDSIRAGAVRLDVLASPGHTPEHIAFILTDEPTSDRPLGAFTGDFVFVGDVGRPDLLERAADIKGTMEPGARQLFGSIQKFIEFDDGLVIWPAHGAGSSCGKSLGGVPVSSLGYEKLSNWALKIGDEDSFVSQVLQGQPDPPKYFAMMKKLNKEGPAILGGFKTPARIGGDRVLSLLESGEQVVDMRQVAKAMNEPVPGTYNIQMGKGFTNWCGWLLKYDRPIYLIAESEADVEQAVRDLASIGLDDVQGWMGLDSIRAYERNNGPLSAVEQVDAKAMVAGGMLVLDVRGTVERAEGFVPGSMHIPLGHLEDRLGELPKNRKIAVHCGGGVRSATAISVLAKHGIRNVCNLTAGLYEYKMAGLP
ncbi:MAG: MBL fold metallo-hydrolase, partial [Armatimonadetes bacterium]|nr:MBL fold metallo-hydrolase [Armatimonadota bacterium]